MTFIAINKNISVPGELANHLIALSQTTSLTGQLQYQLLGRVSLIGASLRALAEAVYYIALGCIGLLVYARERIIKSSYSESALAAAQQIFAESHAAGSVALHSLISLLSPKELGSQLMGARTPDLYVLEPLEEELNRDVIMRSRRLREENLIPEKLQKQLARARAGHAARR